ncbi:MAG: AmmeMemoRadiSam system protein B [Thermoplasmata archaeon]
MRPPAVAGQFYAADREALVTEIEACYASPLGPGRLPGDHGTERSLAGLVVPHAGYMYSGPVAAHAYLALAEDGLPDTYVILGPNHTGYGLPLAVATDDFQTPLGVAKVDRDLAEELIQGLIEGDMEAHRYEHSLEVQVPFLQHLRADVSMVALCMGVQDYQAALEVGARVRAVLKDRDAVIVASTDFSHYVPPEVATVKDRRAIDGILAGDPRGFLSAVQGESISMCGYGPVAAALVALEGPKGELLRYGHSGEVAPMRDVVGYAALTLRT